MRKKLIVLSINAVLAGVGGISQVQAEEAGTRDTVRLEEVVVSATKRDDMVQSVPASVGVMTEEHLKQVQIDSAADLQKAMPGISYKEGGNTRSSSLAIRGVGTIAFSDAIDPSVGAVMDGVVLGRQSSALSNFNDIQRVEVLRGPQGTLFGMNSSAGVLNIVTKDPTPELSGDLGVGYGSYNEIKTHAAVSGPLIEDKLLGRLSLYTVTRDGYIHNDYTGKDLNDDDQKGVRGKLLFTPRETTRLALNLDYVEQQRDCCAAIVRVPDAFGLAYGLGGKESDKMYAVGDYTNNDRNRGVSLEWDEDIGEYTLTSITAVRQSNSYNNNEFNLIPFYVLKPNNTHFDQQQRSEELRIASPTGGKVDYVAGLFIFNQSVSNQTQQTVDFTQEPIPLSVIQAGFVQQGIPPFIASQITGLYNNSTAHIDTLNYAGFGEANFNVTDELTLIAGARWTHIDMDFHKMTDAFAIATTGDVKDSLTDTNTSWRLGARWQFTPDHMTYATISRGYKGPGFNAASGNNTSQQVAPEISTNYELGLKSRFLDDSVRTNLSVFLTKFNDFQAQGADHSGPVTQFVLINAGKLKTRGVEFEIDAVPVANLTLHANMAYTKAEFTQFDGAQCYQGQTAAQGCVGGVQDLAGKPLPGSPEKTFAMNANYDILLNSLPFDAFVRADYNWRSEVQWDLAQDPQGIEGSYSQVGASFGIRGRQEKYTVTAYGKNLTNQFHTSGIFPGMGFPFLGGPVFQYLPVDYKPVYGIAADYHF